MCDEHLYERCGQRIGELVYTGYYGHQLGVFGVVFFEVRTPQDNPIHDSQSDLAAPEPENQDRNVELPSQGRVEEEMPETTTVHQPLPSRKFGSLV